MAFAEEFRLLLALFLPAGVFASAYALSRRLGAGGRLQAPWIPFPALRTAGDDTGGGQQKLSVLQ